MGGAVPLWEGEMPRRRDRWTRLGVDGWDGLGTARAVAICSAAPAAVACMTAETPGSCGDLGEGNGMGTCSLPLLP